MLNIMTTACIYIARLETVGHRLDSPRRREMSVKVGLLGEDLLRRVNLFRNHEPSGM
jgi:hypothetical protein